MCCSLPVANVSPSANEEATSGAMQHALHACGDSVAKQRTLGPAIDTVLLRRLASVRARIAPVVAGFWCG